MKKYKNFKCKIIINPEDDQYCGKCTYSKIVDIYRHKCLLFDKYLSDSYESAKINRCGDCKLVTERFNKMPELDECDE